MIKTICPHCKGDLHVVTSEAVYNLDRIGKSLYQCSCCQKIILVYRDGDDIKTMRISK